MLHLEPEHGRILLHNKRVLLVNADAMGTLRSDLISALGVERAKGFLTRYGWSCGVHDALDMQNRFPWENEREWLLAAPRLHTLEGIVHVTVEQSQIDKEKGLFAVSGTWRNSYEAEQHVQLLGVQEHPVCWTLVGYASGYGSAYLGRQVIYRETACAGRGDPYCRFEGRSLEQWGDAIAAELPYYKEEKIAEQLEQAYEKIRLQHGLLQQTAAIHEELTRLVLEGKGLQKISVSLSRLIGQPVVVEGHDHRVLAVHPKGAYRPGGPDSALGPVGLAAGDRRMAGRLQALANQRRHAVMPALPHLGLPDPWVAAPIVTGNRVMGYVSLLLAGGPIGDLAHMVLERATSVYALDLLKQRAVAEAEQRILGDLLDSLISGELQDADMVLRRARHLGLDLDSPHQVIVLEVTGLSAIAAADDPADSRLQADRSRLLDTVQQALGSLSPGSAATVRGNMLVVLYRHPRRGSKGAEAARILIERLQAAVPEAVVNAGVGTVCAHVGDYAVSFTRARQALEILRGFAQQGRALDFADMGAYTLLFSLPNKRDLLDWARRTLGPLLEYDQKKKGQLLYTLETYLLSDCSLSRTAEATNLHISGLKYRLSRIEKLLGMDLARVQTRFDLYLALMVIRVADVTGERSPG